MRHVVHKYDWLDFFSNAPFLYFHCDLCWRVGDRNRPALYIGTRGGNTLVACHRIARWEFKEKEGRVRLAWWYGFGDEKCTEGWTERTHPVQPGTSSCEARWGPSRASAALPGLQALRAHIWNNFSLCIVTNHGIFQKKAKKTLYRKDFGSIALRLYYNNSTST